MRSSSSAFGHGQTSGNPRLDATIRLHASDTEHNVSGASTVASLVAAMATYLAVIALIITDTLPVPVPPIIQVFVPIPLIVIIAYHVTALAAIMRRAASAELLEHELVRWAGLSYEERRRVGTKRSDEILSIFSVDSSSDRLVRRKLHLAFLYFPYVGWYLIALIATIIVSIDGWKSWLDSARAGEDDGFGVVLLVVGSGLSLLGWAVIAIFAFRVYMKPPPEPLTFRRVPPSESESSEALAGLPDPAPSERVSALSRLHESDIHGNIGANSMSITFFATTAAYVALIATTQGEPEELPAWLFCLVAMPLLLLQAYILLLVAGVIARSDSARIIEDKLFEASGLADIVNREGVGTAQSDVITDLRKISAYSKAIGEAGIFRWAREALSVGPYVGLYMVGLLASVATFWGAYDLYLADQEWGSAHVQVCGMGLVYVAFWLGFGYMTRQLYHPRSYWHSRRGY